MRRKRREGRGENGSPWLRKSRMQFYVTDQDTGRKHALRDKHGQIVCWDDTQTPGENQKRANQIWYDSQSVRRAGMSGDENEVRVVLDLYLQKHVRDNTSATTFDRYKTWFKEFVERWPGLKVRDLGADHIETWWLESHPKWGSSLKSLVGSAFKAGLNWAASRSRGRPLIPFNPIRDWKLPTMKKRSAKVRVSREEFERVLSVVESPRVRDVLEVLWETGTRPINLARATAKHVAAGGDALVFDEHNTPEGASVHKTFKRTGQALQVPLSDRAREIVLRLVKEHPTGPLFLSPRGSPWTASLLANTIRNYAKKVGLEGRFVAYSARHSLASDLLEEGNTSAIVAALLGNTARIVDRNYSHLAAEVKQLRPLLNRRPDARTESATGA